jgi:hypothetical protein
VHARLNFVLTTFKQCVEYVKISWKISQGIALLAGKDYPTRIDFYSGDWKANGSNRTSTKNKEAALQTGGSLYRKIVLPDYIFWLVSKFSR